MDETRISGIRKPAMRSIEITREMRGFGKAVNGNADRVLWEIQSGKDLSTMGAEIEHFEGYNEEEGISKYCWRCNELESEVQRLRDEVLKLRKLINGKGKAKVVIVPDIT